MKQNRREFITTMAAAGAAIPFAKMDLPGIAGTPEKRFPVRLFSKPIDEYDFGFMCECLNRSGIEGFDLTVRPGGKVIPEKVEDDLPRLVGEAKKYNLSIDMMVTSILSPDDQFTERILKTASSVGVTHYRLGWAEYDPEKGIMGTLEGYKFAMMGIAGLNKKYNIKGGYQNHAGARIGGPVWDLYELLKDLPSEYIGCQYDVRHAMVEGTNAWVLGLRLLAPLINSLAIKDFTWQIVKGKPAPVTVPLGEGMVNWELFFRTIKELDLSAPMTLHVEYPLFSKAEESHSPGRKQEIIVSKLKKDMDFLNGYLTKYGLT
ncbi:MAG TPA: xylose isomerase [Bacteroidales bacterium]|nr:xylose isomerase [Bacteroidales bacterium]